MRWILKSTFGKELDLCFDKFYSVLRSFWAYLGNETSPHFEQRIRIQRPKLSKNKLSTQFFCLWKFLYAIHHIFFGRKYFQRVLHALLFTLFFTLHNWEFFTIHFSLLLALHYSSFFTNRHSSLHFSLSNNPLSPFFTLSSLLFTLHSSLFILPSSLFFILHYTLYSSFFMILLTLYFLLL